MRYIAVLLGLAALVILVAFGLGITTRLITTEVDAQAAPAVTDS